MELELKDFSNLNKSLFSQTIEPEKIEKSIVSNFEGGLITESEFLDGINVFDKITKGKTAQIGEIRTWKGGRYQKTSEGWSPVSETGRSESKEEEIFVGGKKKTINVEGENFTVFSDFIKRGTFAINSKGERKQLSSGGYLSNENSIKRRIKQVFMGNEPKHF